MSYEPLFYATIFAIQDCGFIPRCALSVNNAAQNRLQKILDIVSKCKYGIHDISRTELDPGTKLPRFNMPLELGIFLGCGHFGSKIHKSKGCLIMDKTKYRYRKFISDISGHDIFAHGNSPNKAVQCIREWLRTESKRSNIPGGLKSTNVTDDFRNNSHPYAMNCALNSTRLYL